MGPTVKREERDRRLPSVLDDHADRIGVMDADVESVLDGVLELLQRAPFQESQHADELARSQAARLRLQQPAERGEALWQVPLLERLGMIEAPRFLLQERQVVDRIEQILLPLPRATNRSPSISRTSSTVATIVIGR